jgi:hypothetical protein
MRNGVDQSGGLGLLVCSWFSRYGEMGWKNLKLELREVCWCLVRGKEKNRLQTEEQLLTHISWLNRKDQSTSPTPN